jgi:hypothetical protein
VKCGIHVADDVMPMTDAGTLIMRNGPLSVRRRDVPSIAPFAVDVAEPAHNGDAFGEVRYRTNPDLGRTTTRTSFWSGLTAGVSTLGIGLAIAFVAFTAESPVSPRSPHVRAHAKSSLSIESVEVAETRFVPKKKHRVRRPVVATTEEAAPEAPATEPSENE